MGFKIQRMTAADVFPETEKTQFSRRKERACYDRGLAWAIFDEALLCHVAWRRGSHPMLIPTLHVRIGSRLYFHGSVAAASMREMAREAVCVSATRVDGIVLARSHLHHSLNFRSAVAFGCPTKVVDSEHKSRVLAALVEKVLRGRGQESRPPRDAELRATEVLSLELSEVSVRTRSGPPQEASSDFSLPHWGGVVPLVQFYAEPTADEGARHLPMPTSVRRAIEQGPIAGW